MIRITNEISIDEKDVREEFIRSGGPGGQHVNKASTAVQLRFDVEGSALPPDVKERLKRLGGGRIAGDGTLVILARESRSREANRAAALERLVELVGRAAERPRRRVKTRPSRPARQRRMDEKRARGRTKAGRRKVGGED